MPSRRRVPTCKPALPGGRFAPARAAASCRLVSDSNGSRRETLASDGSAVPAGDVLAAFLTIGFFTGFGAAVAAFGAAAGLAGAFGAAACAAGFAAGCLAATGGAGFAAGLAAGGGACAAGFAAGAGACAAGFAAVFGGAAGADWACALLPAVASKIPVITVIARRMARSSLLTVFSPAEPHLWPHLLVLNQLAS